MMKKTLKLSSSHSSVKNSCLLLLFCVAATILLPAQSFTTLVKFDNTNGSTPLASLIQGVDGNLYGTTAGGGKQFGTAFQMTTAGNLTTLYEFCSVAIVQTAPHRLLGSPWDRTVISTV